MIIPSHSQFCQQWQPQFLNQDNKFQPVLKQLESTGGGELKCCGIKKKEKKTPNKQNIELLIMKNRNTA